MKKIAILYLFFIMLLLISCKSNIEKLSQELTALEEQGKYETAYFVLNKFLYEAEIGENEQYIFFKKLAHYEDVLNNPEDSLLYYIKCYEIALDLNDTKKIWESSSLFVNLLQKYNDHLKEHQYIEILTSIYERFINLDQLNDSQISLGVRISDLFRNLKDYKKSANTLFYVYHEIDKEPDKNDVNKVSVLSRISKIYALTNQPKDVVEVEKIKINYLLDESYTFEDKNDQLLLALYNIVLYKGFITAQEYLQELENYFLTTNEYDIGRFYLVWGDLKNMQNDSETHSYYVKSIKNLSNAEIIDINIFNTLIKDSLFLYRTNQFSLIRENEILFTSLLQNVDSNKYDSLRTEMNKIMSDIDGK